MRSQHVRSTVLSILLFALCGTILWSRFEAVDEQIWVSQVSEVRRDPLLASQRFLRAMGLAASEGNLLNDHRSGDVVLLASQRRTITPQCVTSLLQWVEQGGHLIVAEPSRFSSQREDPLLHALNLETSLPKPSKLCRADYVQFTLPQTPVPFTVDVRAWPRFFDPQAKFQTLAQDTLGACLLHQIRGRGAVTVLCDASILTNASIGKHDHAALLWRLVNLHKPATQVELIHVDDLPALPIFLWQHASHALMALSVLLFVSGWRAGLRFGPRLDLPPKSRRSVLEHIDASGRFYWRWQPCSLLVAMHAGIEQQCTKRYPDWKTLDSPMRLQRLAELTGIPKAQLGKAFDVGGLTPDETAFTALMQDLQTIRKAL